jgi:hypothetical protein
VDAVPFLRRDARDIEVASIKFSQGRPGVEEAELDFVDLA